MSLTYSWEDNLWVVVPQQMELSTSPNCYKQSLTGILNSSLNSDFNEIAIFFKTHMYVTGEWKEYQRFTKLRIK